MSAVLEPSSAAPERIRKISKEEGGGVAAQFTVDSVPTSGDELGKPLMRKVSTTVRKMSTVSTGRKVSMVGGPDWTRKMSAESAQRKISTVARSDSDVQRRMTERPRKISRYNRECTEENTLRFVYSEAVERAIRTRFRSSAFPPISRIGRGVESRCEIPKLPEMFEDWILVRKCRKNNVYGERSWKAKEERRRSTTCEESYEESGSTRLPKLQNLKMLRLNKNRGSIASRLPPVLKVCQEDSPNSSEGTTPQPDFSFMV